MASPDVRGRKAWRVRIAAHTVGGRYAIAERDETRFEGERVSAVRQAVRDAHIRAEVPPWKPFLRESVPHVSVAETWWTPGE